jgi:hypothetical protein
MRRDTRNFFFREASTHQVMEHQRGLLHKEAATMPPATVLDGEVDDLAAKLAKKHSVDVPVLNDEGTHVKQSEVDIDISRDPRRDFWGDAPHSARGVEINFFVPFTGDAAMFEVQPNTSQGSLLGEVVKNEIVYTARGLQLNPVDVRREFDAWLAGVKLNLDWHRQALGNFNQELAGIARNEILQRRAKLSADRDLVAGLGFPVKH